MPFEPGQRVAATAEGLGPLVGVVVRDAAEPTLAAPATPGAPPPAGGSGLYVVRWTLEDGSVVTNTTAESVLRPAD